MQTQRQVLIVRPFACMLHSEKVSTKNLKKMFGLSIWPIFDREYDNMIIN